MKQDFNTTELIFIKRAIQKEIEELQGDLKRFGNDEDLRHIVENDYNRKMEMLTKTQAYILG